MCQYDPIYKILFRFGLFNHEYVRGLTQKTLRRAFDENLKPKGNYELKRRLQHACVQRWQCEACKQIMQETDGYMNTATLEHIIPRAHGGRNGNNLTATCFRCNQIRGDMPWHRFIEYSCRFGTDDRPINQVERSYYKQLKQVFG